MRSHSIARSLTLALLAVVVVGLPLWAQGGLPGNALASQSLRPYRFVFIAYALAWALVFGWVVSVARKASAVARRLEE